MILCARKEYPVHHWDKVESVRAGWHGRGVEGDAPVGIEILHPRDKFPHSGGPKQFSAFANQPSTGNEGKFIDTWPCYDF